MSQLLSTDHKALRVESAKQMQGLLRELGRLCERIEIECGKMQDYGGRKGRFSDFMQADTKGEVIEVVRSLKILRTRFTVDGGLQGNMNMIVSLRLKTYDQLRKCIILRMKAWV